MEANYRGTLEAHKSHHEGSAKVGFGTPPKFGQ
jgi:hypothetical protein